MKITHSFCSENQQPCVIIQRQLLRSGFQSCHDDFVKYIDMYAHLKGRQQYFTSSGYKTHDSDFKARPLYLIQYETDYYMHQVTPSIKTEKNPFLALGQKVISTIENVLSPVNTSLYIYETWGNTLVQGNIIEPHSHGWNGPKASYVYVYNISVCENCASLVFPTVNNGMRISPKIGQIVIFSGWLVHAVDEHECDHPRINAGGNIGDLSYSV